MHSNFIITMLLAIKRLSIYCVHTITYESTSI